MKDSILIRTLKSFRDGYDHDADAHKYGNLPACRVCAATKALEEYTAPTGKSKEEILDEECSDDLLKLLRQDGTPEELKYFKRYILDAMEAYASQFRASVPVPEFEGWDYCKDCNQIVNGIPVGDGQEYLQTECPECGSITETVELDGLNEVLQKLSSQGNEWCNKSMAAGRKFTLKEMFDCWDESGNYHSADGFMKDSPDKVSYFKAKFNIDIEFLDKYEPDASQFRTAPAPEVGMDAKKVLDWLLTQSDLKKIDMVDGVFYYAEDHDGDQPLYEDEILKLYSKENPSASAPEVEERDNFAISFAVWALHDPQAKAYQEAGITAYGLLEKYKSRPFIDTINIQNQ